MKLQRLPKKLQQAADEVLKRLKVSAEALGGHAERLHWM